jgi:hypothetical protein
MNELSSDGPLSASVMAVTQPKLLTGPSASVAPSPSGDTTSTNNGTTPAASATAVPSIIPSLPAMRGPYMGGMTPQAMMPMQPMMPMMHPGQYLLISCHLINVMSCLIL